MTRANGRWLAAVRLAILMAVILLGANLLDSSGVAFGQMRAFPEAEGFGAFATGGRGGNVYHVTNLNDSGTGSFRDAVSTGNRIVVFDVGGWIELASPVSVQDNITIAGQTAPGDGIGLKNYGVSFSNAENLIARHLRVRQGPYVDSVGRDGIGATGASNVIFDHISASWGRDENFSINSSTNVTIQNSVVAEGLLNHSMGGLIEWNEGISIHHSLYVSNNDRNPKTKGILDFTNNVVFNWGAFAYVAGDSAGLSYGNVVNNYFIAGPSSSELHDPISRGNRNYSMYLDGNYYDGNLNGVLDGTAFTQADVDDELTYVAERFDYPLVEADSATRAYEKVLNKVGASLSRDSADTRIINGVRTQNGMMINDPAEVGGWGALAGGPAPLDTDQDGMPNAWETARGLNPNNAADRNNLNLFGYTRIEEYINELGGAHTQKVWRAASGTWSTAATWTSPGLPTDDDTAFVRGNTGAAGAATIGSADASVWDARIGGDGAANLSVVSGGLLKVKNTLLVGDAGTGVLTVDGGTVEATNVVIGSFGYGGSVSVLAGGVLKSKFIARDGVGGSVTLSGGTIAALQSLTVSAPINIVGSGTIDTAGHDATVPSIIASPGSGGQLIKSGDGTLTLSATNSYTGGTKLAGGTLSIASSANIGGIGSQIEFAGGTLRVTGTGIGHLNNHTVNWSSFDGGIDVAAGGHTFVVDQSLSGAGTLAKQGPGTLIMTGANNHGGMIAAGGVLSVLDDTRLGAPAAPLGLAGGTLRFTTTGSTDVARATTLTGASTIHVQQASGIVTMSQPMSGAGSIAKTGPGTLILGAANTHTGGTTISAGTLRITNPLALQNSTVTLSGGTLDLNNLAASVGGLAGTGSVDLRGTVLTLGGSNQDSTYAGNIISSSGVASVEKIGTGTINLSGTNTYTGGTVLRGGALGITTSTNIGGTTSAITFDGGLLRINGNSMTSMGSHVVNWSTFDGGFDIATAGHSFAVSQAIEGNGSLTKRGAGRLLLTSTANSYTGGTRLEGGSLEISTLSNIGGANAAVTFAGGILRTTGTAITSLADNDVNWSTFDGGFDISNSGSVLTLSHAIAGAGLLTKLGSGGLRMNVANTYSGDTTLNAGTLMIAHQDALAQTNLVPGGGTLAITATNSMNVGGLKGSGALALGDFTVNVGGNNQDSTYSGVLSSSQAQGQVNKVGAGTLTLTGNSSYARPITVKEGAIAVSNVANIDSNSPLGRGTLILDGGKLVYNGSSTGTTNRLFTLTENGGTIEAAGTGKLSLAATGNIVQSGTGDRTFTLMGVNADCEFTFALGDPASGKTSFRKDEGGRWIMNGAASTLTYSGDTIIDAGILILNSDARLPFGAGKGHLVINDGQFEMNGRDMSINGLYGAGNIQNRTSTRTLTLGNANADGDFSGVVSNTGGGQSTQLLNVTKVGTGTQIFSGFNTYGGVTDVQAGALVVASRAAAGLSAIQVSGGVLRVDPGVDEALELYKTIAIGGTPSTPTGTIDIASGGFIASKDAGNSLATLLAWQNAGMVQNTGKGLVSSWVLSNPDYGLAVVDNADLGLASFHGRDVTTDSLVVAPALLGDANLDSTVNFADLVTLVENYGAANSTWAESDFNADRKSNFADFSLVEQLYGELTDDFAAAWAIARGPEPLPGDFNSDGIVDAADYTVWRNTGGTSEQYAEWKVLFGAALTGGAAIADTRYDAARANYAETRAGKTADPAVPEPCAALLIVCGLPALLLRARRLRRSVSRRPGRRRDRLTKIAEEGLELASKSAENTPDSQKGGAESGALLPNRIDSTLQLVANAWPKLSPAARKAIAGIVRTDAKRDS